MLVVVVICLAVFVLTVGMFLLAKTRKDNLGPFFRFVSWFVIIAGFVLIFTAICGGICRTCARHHRMMCDKEFMHERCMPGPWFGNHHMMDRWGDKGCCMGEMSKEGGMCCMNGEKGMGCGPGMGMEGRECRGGMMGAANEMDNLTPEQKADETIKMLTEKLNLTTSEVPKVHDIILKSLKDKEMQMKAVAEEKEKCGKMCDKICQEKLDALKKVLTPDQFKNLPECCTKMCSQK